MKISRDKMGGANVVASRDAQFGIRRLSKQKDLNIGTQYRVIVRTIPAFDEETGLQYRDVATINYNVCPLHGPVQNSAGGETLGLQDYIYDPENLVTLPDGEKKPELEELESGKFIDHSKLASAVRFSNLFYKKQAEAALAVALETERKTVEQKGEQWTQSAIELVTDRVNEEWFPKADKDGHKNPPKHNKLVYPPIKKGRLLMIWIPLETVRGSAELTPKFDKAKLYWDDVTSNYITSVKDAQVKNQSIRDELAEEKDRLDERPWIEYNVTFSDVKSNPSQYKVNMTPTIVLEKYMISRAPQYAADFEALKKTPMGVMFASDDDYINAVAQKAPIESTTTVSQVISKLMSEFSKQPTVIDSILELEDADFDRFSQIFERFEFDARAISKPLANRLEMAKKAKEEEAQAPTEAPTTGASALDQDIAKGQATYEAETLARESESDTPDLNGSLASLFG